jgi:hypothetical protein
MNKDSTVRTRGPDLSYGYRTPVPKKLPITKKKSKSTIHTKSWFKNCYNDRRDIYKSPKEKEKKYFLNNL